MLEFLIYINVFLITFFKIINYLETHNVQNYLINKCSLMEINFNFPTGIIIFAEMNYLGIVLKLFNNI